MLQHLNRQRLQRCANDSVFDACLFACSPICRSAKAVPSFRKDQAMPCACGLRSAPEKMSGPAIWMADPAWRGSPVPPAPDNLDEIRGPRLPGRATAWGGHITSAAAPSRDSYVAARSHRFAAFISLSIRCVHL